MKTLLYKAITFILGAVLAFTVATAKGQTNHTQDAHTSFKVAAVTAGAGLVLITGSQMTEQGQRLVINRKGIKLAAYNGTPQQRKERIGTFAATGCALFACTLASAYIGIQEYRMGLGVTNDGLTLSYTIR